MSLAILCSVSVRNHQTCICEHFCIDFCFPCAHLFLHSFRHRVLGRSHWRCGVPFATQGSKAITTDEKPHWRHSLAQMCIQRLSGHCQGTCACECVFMRMTYGRVAQLWFPLHLSFPLTKRTRASHDSLPYSFVLLVSLRCSFLLCSLLFSVLLSHC